MSEPLLQFHQLTHEEALKDQQDADHAHQQWLASTCPCKEPDENYLLGVESGRIELRHQACGKPPRWYEDWEEDALGDGIPVKARIFTACDCNPYVTMGHECGPEVHITPRSS